MIIKENETTQPRISLEFPSEKFKSIIASTFSELLEKELKPLILHDKKYEPLLTKRDVCKKMQIKPSTFEYHKNMLMEFGMFQPNGEGSSFRMRSGDLERYIDHLISKGSLK